VGVVEKDNAAACFCFLNYLAFIRPKADRAVSILSMGYEPRASQVQSSYLSPIMHFALCKEQQHSQKQEFFVIMV
jgi:hypothetical protein